VKSHGFYAYMNVGCVTGRASGRLVHGKLLSMIAECSLHVLRHKCGKNIAVNQLNKVHQEWPLKRCCQSNKY